MDRAGDIALGFNAMSRDQFSSVYMAGRKPSFNWATHNGAFKFDRCRPNVK